MIPIIRRRDPQELLAEQMRRQLESTHRWHERQASALLAHIRLTVEPCDCCTTAPTDSEGEE